MRIPLSSLQAFVHDAENSGAGDASQQIARWFAVAQSAERIATLAPQGRADYLSRLADTVLPERQQRPTQTEGDGRVPTDELSRLSERLRLEVEDMERAGCFELALCTISAVCRIMTKGPSAARLLATAHMGRVMRQIGELDAASECYQTVIDEAFDARDPAIAAHGFIGLGNVATFRGNRPAQRQHFMNAVENAPQGSPAEISAHQGLLLVSIAQHHLADALLHGWRAHDLAPPESETQLEVINNMAHAALQSGFPIAARAGFDHTLHRTRLARLRMPAISGAVRASASMDNRDDVERYETLGTEQIAVGAPPFETAQYFLRCAESWDSLGDISRRDANIDSGEVIADQFGFHEVRMRLETLRKTVAPVRSARTQPTPFTLETADPTVRVGIERLQTLEV